MHDSHFYLGLHGLPKRSGKLKDLSKFDASFFGVHPRQANAMDPQLRMLLEVTYESIADAGKNHLQLFFPLHSEIFCNTVVHPIIRIWEP